MIKSSDCIFKKISLFPQTISDEDISKLIYTIYTTTQFSTIPYKCYNETSSKSSMMKYRSGSCIALVEAAKYYLKSNLDINGYIIPANTPNIIKIPGTPNLSHCAILIPKSYTEFYIFDPAFYFMEFMYCDLENNIKRQIKSSNPYADITYSIEYTIKPCTHLLLDQKYNQKLLNDCSLVECSINNSGLSDSWNYYLNEIKNPDDNIGESLLINKPHPFLLYTIFDNNCPKIKYKMTFKNGIITIYKYPANKISFNNTIARFENSFIKQELNKYLSKTHKLS